MELNRAMSSLLRTASLQSLIYTHTAPRQLQHCHAHLFQRSFSASSTRLDEPPPSGQAPRAQPQRKGPPTNSSNDPFELGGKLDFLSKPKPQATARASRPGNAPSPPPQGATDAARGLLRDLQAPRSPQRPAKGIDTDLLRVPHGSRSANGYEQIIPMQALGHMPLSESRAQMDPTAPPPFRLGPRLGKTVSVNESRYMDVGRAFRQLDAKCGMNKIRQDASKQRFHERPGLRRKRLRSSRHRRRFKENFQAVVRRVEELKRKGW